MKAFLKQCLSGSILCIVLLVSAVPFAAAQAQSGGKTDAAPKTEAKTSADSKEITLLLEGKIYRAEFIFEGNTIRFNDKYPLPENITVDGKPWKDLAKPFELDYTPDFAKAGILERDGKLPFYVNVEEKRLSLRIEYINDMYHHSMDKLEPFRVRLAMKNQYSHDKLIGYRSVYRKHEPRALLGPGQMKEKLWNDSLKERKIVLSGNIVGQGTFIFEGRTIRYQHEAGDYPYYVNVNGRSWNVLFGEPFELPFQIDTIHPEIVKTEGENPVKTTMISDKRFEISIRDLRKPSPTHSSHYTVTISQGKTVENK